MLKRITPKGYRRSLFIGEKGVEIDLSKSREDEIRKYVKQGIKEMKILLPETSGNKGPKPHRGIEIGGW